MRYSFFSECVLQAHECPLEHALQTHECPLELVSDKFVMVIC